MFVWGGAAAAKVVAACGKRWGYRLYATQRDNPGAFRPWLLYRSTPQSSRSVLTCVCLGPAKVAGLGEEGGAMYRLYASQRSIRNSAISARLHNLD